jgi:hypothetical protein
MSDTLSTDNILPLIQTVRDQRVILAADLARLYGVKTYRLNEAVKRNKLRFPSDFTFQLTRAEALVILRSQNAILKSQPAVPKEDTDSRSQFATLNAQPSEAEEDANSTSQFATLNAQGFNIKHLPYAFTEHGAIMAANVLNSPRAVAMSVHRPRVRASARGHRSQRRDPQAPRRNRPDAAHPRRGPTRHLPETPAAAPAAARSAQAADRLPRNRAKIRQKNAPSLLT